MTNRTIRRAAPWSALAVLAATLSAAALLAPGSVRAASVSVAVENYDFAPASRTITAGDVVRWSFSGDQHSVTSRDGLFDSGVKDAGGSFQFTFKTAGTYRYYCVVHPDLMSGTIVVKAAPATPRPTVKPTVKPSPKPSPTPTPRPTVKPSPTPPPASPTAEPSPSALPSAAAPTASANASQALAETPAPTSVTSSPAPAPTEPAGTDGTTPIVAVGALLAVITVGGALIVARRRRAV